MPFNKSTDVPGPGRDLLRFKCGNVRTAFLAFDMIFWLFTLVFLCQMAMHLGFPGLALKARAVNDFFGGHTAAFMAGPVVVLATLLYYYCGRTSISWRDGLRIDDKPQQEISYQLKTSIGGVPLIYIQGGGKVYILYPVTSQDSRRFPDAEVMRREREENQVKVALLESKLIESGAKEKWFWFFTWDVTISFLVFILIVSVAFLSN